jgi:hypothetical protein
MIGVSDQLGVRRYTYSQLIITDNQGHTDQFIAPCISLTTIFDKLEGAQIPAATVRYKVLSAYESEAYPRTSTSSTDNTYDTVQACPYQNDSKLPVCVQRQVG